MGNISTLICSERHKGTTKSQKSKGIFLELAVQLLPKSYT